MLYQNSSTRRTKAPKETPQNLLHGSIVITSFPSLNGRQIPITKLNQSSNSKQTKVRNKPLFPL